MDFRKPVCCAIYDVPKLSSLIEKYVPKVMSFFDINQKGDLGIPTEAAGVAKKVDLDSWA